MKKPTKTESRKKQHVDFVLDKGAQYVKTSGFERVEFMHNALPEISMDSVDLSVRFLGSTLRWPIVICAATGGYGPAERINHDLASAAQRHGLAFGLGSQRAMIEEPALAKTYNVRDVAPDVPLLANIGAYQLKHYPIKKIEAMVSAVDADALAIHLNALQEAIQPEGDRDFSGVLCAITKTCERLSVPVIVKETGAGISQDVAIRLKEAGVKYIDVAGAGGTSWSKVEYLRSKGVPGFEEWGIPTVECIIQCRGVLPLIASGGIRCGIDGAKAIALGAELWGAAYPFIVAQSEGKLDAKIEKYKTQMQVAAYLSGSKSHEELKRAKLIFR